MTTTAAGRRRSAAVALFVASWLSAPALTAAPAFAHPEGLQPYRYVAAPPGVESEGPPEQGTSVQPIGAAGFAGTTDNQMQLTLPPGALPARVGEQGVRVQLDQLDPATLPPLPDGLEPEGNAYRLTLTYARSGIPVPRLTGATLSMTAPAPPTGMLELLAGRWEPLASKTVVGDEVNSSVVDVTRPGTLLQVYDPTTAPAAGRPSATTSPTATPRSPSTIPTLPAVSAQRSASTLTVAAGAAAVLVTVSLLAVRRRQLRQ